MLEDLCFPMQSLRQHHTWQSLPVTMLPTLVDKVTGYNGPSKSRHLQAVSWSQTGALQAISDRQVGREQDISDCYLGSRQITYVASTKGDKISRWMVSRTDVFD